MRANMPRFGKTSPLENKHFDDFIACFGDDPYGLSSRVDQGENGCFRRFTREEIAKRDDNLDISWLSEDRTGTEDGLIELDDISAAILGHLRSALLEIESVTDELAEPIEAEE